MNNITKNRKYNDILSASKVLFWKYGFRKVTIEEICREAKTSKMTFYKFFPNKVEVAKALLDQVIRQAIDDFRVLQEQASSPVALIEGMLKMKKTGVHEISKDFLADFYADSELGLRAYMEAKTMEVFTTMLADFKSLQARGLIRQDLNLEFYLYLANKMNGYMEDPYLLSLFPNPEDMIMEFTNLFAYGLSPKSEKP